MFGVSKTERFEAMVWDGVNTNEVLDFIDHPNAGFYPRLFNGGPSIKFSDSYLKINGVVLKQEVGKHPAPSGEMRMLYKIELYENTELLLQSGYVIEERSRVTAAVDPKVEKLVYPDLSDPLDIKTRIKLAIREDLQHQVIPYRRKEGASRAIIEIASGAVDIFLYVPKKFRNWHWYKGCSFYECSMKDGIIPIEKSIVIVDSPFKMKDKELAYAYANGNKIIQLKGLVHDKYKQEFRLNHDVVEL